jgi:uncharacterized protein YbjT (DUF2867 family)
LTSSRAALLLGATGLVGGHCRERLLAEERYARVVVLGRRPSGREHPKLEEHRVDFERLAEARERFAVDDVFCCLGTTIRKAGSREAFRRVDHDYPVEAARLASSQGASRFLLVSAMGADPGSRFFYSRVKGEAERAVRAIRFAAVWVVRPSLLLGEREETRPGEKAAELVLRPLGPLMVGPLRRYRAIHARDVAAAMLRLALSDGTGGVVENDRLHDLAADPR